MSDYFLSLESISLTGSHPDSHHFDIRLSGYDRDRSLVELAFFQVTEINIGNIGRNTLMHVSIVDIRDWQREGTRFSVSEEEHGYFSFKCAGISDPANEERPVTIDTAGAVP